MAQPLPGGPQKILLRGGYHGRYLPSGHLVYIHEGTLFAATFDLDRLEVTGQPVPAGRRWQVSTDGGNVPMWSRTGRELYFYHTEDQRIMVASYTVDGDRFRAEKARLWSEGRIPIDGSFDLHPDGLRFAVLSASEPAEAKQGHVVLILNFFDYLRQIAPAQGRGEARTDIEYSR